MSPRRVNCNEKINRHSKGAFKNSTAGNSAWIRFFNSGSNFGVTASSASNSTNQYHCLRRSSESAG